MRPGQKPQAFSADDTLVGFKGDSSMGGITIGAINVSGVSGDPAQFAYELAQELKRELKTI